MTHWSFPYVGIPWESGGRTRAGVDCWGLVRVIYSEIKGIDLRSFDKDYYDAEEREVIRKIIEGEAYSGAWRAVDLSNAREFDVLLFRCFGEPSHLGIIVDANRRLMLHITSGRDSAIERYDSACWASRLCCVYRHAGVS